MSLDLTLRLKLRAMAGLLAGQHRELELHKKLHLLHVDIGTGWFELSTEEEEKLARHLTFRSLKRQLERGKAGRGWYRIVCSNEEIGPGNAAHIADPRNQRQLFSAVPEEEPVPLDRHVRIIDKETRTPITCEVNFALRTCGGVFSICRIPE